MKFNTITLLVATIAVILSSANACRCVDPITIEKDYFDSNTKFFVKAIPVNVIATPNGRTYKLRIVKQYKSCTKISSATVSTSLTSCGIPPLKLGTEYVLPLNSIAASINLCQVRFLNPYFHSSIYILYFSKFLTTFYML